MILDYPYNLIQFPLGYMYGTTWVCFYFHRFCLHVIDEEGAEEAEELGEG